MKILTIECNLEFMLTFGLTLLRDVYDIFFPVPDPRNDYVDLQHMNSDQDIKGTLYFLLSTLISLTLSCLEFLETHAVIT